MRRLEGKPALFFYASIIFASLCFVHGGLTITFKRVAPATRPPPTPRPWWPQLTPFPVGQGQTTPTTKLSQKVTDGNATSKQVVESFHVQTDIRYRFATTRMCSVVRNTAGTSREMKFDVTLPKEAFIVSFSMSIDGKVYQGEVKRKREAKKQYKTSMRKGESAGHIRQSPRHSNRFDVSVNVASGSSVNFTLIYQQILSRKRGVYEHKMHVDPGQPVKDFRVEVFIQENRPLSFVKIPEIRKASTASNKIKVLDGLTTVNRPTETTAHIQYTPSLEQQGKGGMSAQFVVQYDVEHSKNGDLLVADGFFLHLFSPKLRNRVPKDIIFVLDTSGSMKGTKIAQLKDAMKTILADLTEVDRFNILTFNYDVSKWRHVLAEVTPTVVEEAKRFLDSMVADGRTNINQGLLKALDELQGRELQERAAMVFFLTDGEATIDEKDPAKIAENVMRTNTDNASIYSLAFGESADFECVKTISAQNDGYARKIYEASDAALQVESLYNEISVVAMKNVKVKYLPGVSKTTQTVYPILYNGTEMAIFGRYDELTFSSPAQKVPFRAEVVGIDGEGALDIVLKIDDIGGVIIDEDDSLNSMFTMPRDYSGILEKMWAFTTIKQLLKERRGVPEQKDKVNELNAKITEMSLRYKFVTPLTSMVVTKPDSVEPVETCFEDADGSEEDSGTQHRSKTSFTPWQDPNVGSSSINTFLSQPNGGIRLVDQNFDFPLRNSNSDSQKHHSSDPHTHAGVSIESHIEQPTTKAHTPLPVLSLDGSDPDTHSPQPGVTIGKKGLVVDGNDFFSLIQKSESQTFRPNDPYTQEPITSNPLAVRKTERKRKNKTRKGKKSVLSALKSIVFRSDKQSLCFVPQYVPSGKYILARHTSPSGIVEFKVKLITGCFRKCRVVFPKTLALTSKGNTIKIDLTSLNKWKTVGHNSDFVVKYGKRNKLILKHQYGTVSLIRKMRKRRVFLSLEIKARDLGSYSGVAETLSLTQNKSESGQPQHEKSGRRRPSLKSCKKSKADFSRFLTKGLAEEYKIER